MNRRAFLAGVAGSASAALAGCTGILNTGSDAPDGDIGMGSVSFNPKEFEVEVGETVVWVNTDMRNHSVTAYEAGIPEGAEYFASGGFESEQAARDAWRNGNGTINPNTTYEHTFEVPGEYAYFCIPHESGGMSGTIVVTE
ncbi:plastocyanin/azurin family copper-binding protein [Haladaptatus pallidirubidus]|uniref:Plastocyanin/azurin family copper-binding protein n=1 Tax=Haladaptatus pallidirubidus TaxID=1008152 RepID=A0AAV3UCM4_9EURY|nr:plastocyanin/azurin family copper-binding protein [Haladaptatus pallidirubidus]